MDKHSIRVVVAGHICLDITPAFPGQNTGRLEDILRPGGLVAVGEAVVHVGGCVANTGLALRFFGANTTLMAKVGGDAFGDIIFNQISEQGFAEGIAVSGSEHSSYSVVLSPPGIDRMFLHHPGSNDTFGDDSINYSLVKGASLFHLGYPPVLKRLYRDGGGELIKILKAVKRLGVPTSVDMASAGENTEAAGADWEAILRGALPYVDFFVPSAEEIAALIDPGRYREWVARAGGRDVAGILSPERDIAPLAETLLGFGAKVVLIKCGAAGMYLAATNSFELQELGGGLCLRDWAAQRFFEPSYRPSRVLSATGAGDTSIAAFLYAALSGCSWRECLQYATAAGASCVTAYDALSGLLSFDAMRAKIQSGWEKQNI